MTADWFASDWSVRRVSNPVDRFWAKVEKTDDGCWLWQAAKTWKGYGSFTAAGRVTVSAHRFAYELLVGPIPDGLDIDHLCRVRHCVNPDHLEPVTRKENLLRGTNHVAENAVKTRCLRGHPFTPENTAIQADGGRSCRECRRLRDRIRGRQKYVCPVCGELRSKGNVVQHRRVHAAEGARG